MKIRTKLLALMVVIVLVVAVLVSTMYVRTRSVTLDIANEEALGTVENLTKIIDIYFTGLANIGENASPGVKTLFRADGSVERQRVVALMEELLDINRETNKMMNIYVGSALDGSLMTGNGFVAPDDYDSRTRPWYTDAAATRKTIVTAPYIDADSKMLVISTGTPFYADNGTLLGVIGTDVSLEILANNIKVANVLGSGYGVLMTADGTVVEHPERSFIAAENFSRASANVSQELAALGQKMVARQKAFGDYTMQGSKRRIYFAPSNSGYVAGLVFPHAQLNRTVRSVTMLQIVAGSIAIVLLVVVMLLIIPSITRPLKTVERSLARMAGLDLTVDEDTVALERTLDPATELGAMVLSLRNLRQAFNAVVASVREGVGRTASSARTLDGLSEGATQEVSSAKSAITNAESMAQNALQAVGGAAMSIQEVTHAATMTATSATEGAEASSSTARLSSQVSEMVDGFVKDLRSVGQASAENSKGMAEVGASVASIGEFVTTIRNIASQTNLLALNAAIEAARAGEAGRGFAVVADEVRKLAEESSEASQHVAEMIEKLENGTSTAIQSTQESAGIISGIVDKAQDTQTRLQNVLAEIDKVNDAVQTIAAAAEEQAASSNEISESTSQVRDSVGSVAGEITMINRAAGETYSAIKRVAEEAGSLAAIASDLERIMADFHTEDARGGHAALQAPKRATA